MSEKLYRWVKATPDNLPKEGDDVFMKIRIYDEFMPSIGCYRRYRDGFLSWRGEHYPIDKVEFLQELPTPEEGKAYRSKEEIIRKTPFNQFGSMADWALFLMEQYAQQELAKARQQGWTDEDMRKVWMIAFTTGLHSNDPSIPQLYFDDWLKAFKADN